MTEKTDFNFDGLDVDMARRIDVICRRFEADWRAGRQPRVEDYLVDISDEGRPALRAELEALERELCPSDETVARPEAGPATAPEPQTAPNPSTIAEAATVAPGQQPTSPIPDTASPAVHEQATLPPRDQATGDFGPSRPAQPDATSPDRVRYFGDYELLREIARGGMGVVYRARQVSLNRPVALKMILAGQLAGDDEVKRFYLEAEAAANLDHPGIVPIYEIGEHDGQHYFSMGFVEGTSLAAKVADGPLPPNEAAELVRQVAQAVQYAHERGVIHRDLKPANVLLDSQGQPKVTDFGLAKKLKADSGLTHTGQVMGTPSYMPPEQAEGRNVGTSADVYALGAIVYCLLTGRPPFQAATPMDTLLQVVGQEPVPVRQLNATVPRDLETICLKCLEKDPRRRYGSARALAEELNRFLSGEPIVARPVGPAERAAKWVRRRPVIAALSAAVVVTGLLGLSGIIWQWREAVAARIDAQSQAANTREQAGIARDNERAARNEAEFANRRLYDVKMNLVQRAWEDWGPTVFLETLAEQLPENQRGLDRRGFEWFYWQRKMSSGHITLKGHTGGVTSVAFSPDGKRLASAGSGQINTPGELKVWNAATGQETLTLKGHSDGVTSVAFSPNGQRLSSASRDGTVKVWDAVTGQEALTVMGHTREVTSVAYSPDGTRLASASSDGTVKVWDAVTGQETLTLMGHTGAVNSVAFSPDGSRIAAASQDEADRLGWVVKVWDAATGRETLLLKGHTGFARTVAFSPDGSRLASASSDRTAKVWDAVTGQETLTLRGHAGVVTALAFSPDGSRLASASEDGTVKVWDAVTGQERLTLKGHNNFVWGVAFSPDGLRLASASSDKTVRVWDMVTGQETLTLKGHTDMVFGVAFSADGTRLASAGRDGTVKVWDACEVTLELLERDEARGLILFLVERLATEAELRDRIDRDRTRSSAVRAAALDMVRGFWAMRIRRRAETIVEPLFARMFVRDDVLAALEAQPAADPEIQAACLKLAGTWAESARECNNAGFALVRDPGRPQAIYQRGLRLAKSACRMEPDNGLYLNTLGVAQYRAGSVAEGLTTLTRSNALNKEKEPADLALLAMAHQRLGQSVEARAMLDQLRDMMRQAGPNISQSAENRAFLAEAEAVVLYDPIFPVDPFAP